MTNKKLNDEEIIAHLKCCAESNNCKGCVYSKHCDGVEHLINALDLINRQKAEIEGLNIQVRELWKMASLYKAESERWEGYNENLLTANTDLSNEIPEAYKEFAERLKECCDLNDDLSTDAWLSVTTDIDCVLKEMVGEEE